MDAGISVVIFILGDWAKTACPANRNTTDVIRNVSVFSLQSCFLSIGHKNPEPCVTYSIIKPNIGLKTKSKINLTTRFTQRRSRHDSLLAFLVGAVRVVSFAAVGAEHLWVQTPAIKEAHRPFGSARYCSRLLPLRWLSKKSVWEFRSHAYAYSHHPLISCVTLVAQETRRASAAACRSYWLGLPDLVFKRDQRWAGCRDTRLHSHVDRKVRGFQGSKSNAKSKGDSNNAPAPSLGGNVPFNGSGVRLELCFELCQ